MQAYRIHGKNGVQFEDDEPQEACVYDIVDLKLPEGAAVLQTGGGRCTLRRVRLPGNSYSHLETLDDKPILRIEAQRAHLVLNTNDFVELDFELLEENLRCDFEIVCSHDAPDNRYCVTFSNGRYRLADLYGSRPISRQEAMCRKAEWG